MRTREWVAMTLVCVVALGASACKKDADDKDEMAEDKMDKGGQMAGSTAMAPVQYRIVVKSLWTPALHPFEYPAAGALTGPHFSGLIGASHNASYQIFSEGSLPTAGLEHLSEEGKHSRLDDEIHAAIKTGSAGVLFESGALRDFTDSLVTTVKVDSAHPMVSVVAMVAPSPDWFTGVSDLNLMENGAWVPSRTLDLNAWDSGGDDGTTYKAPDKDNNPKKPTSKAMTRHFVTDGKVVPVGSITFTRM